MGKLSLRFLYTSLLCICLCGCQTVGDILKDIFDSDRTAELPDIGSGATYEGEGPRIRAGVGLIVQVTVTGQQVRQMEVMVDENGEATIPYLLTEPVKCDGLTLDAFRQKLVKQYLEFIKQPQVTVRFAPVTTGAVSPYGTVKVMGQVNNPGPVNMPPTMDLTVTKALQAAGGLRQFANKRKIQVARRQKDGTLTKMMVDLIEIGEGGRAEKDIQLKSGDVVYAHETIW